MKKLNPFQMPSHETESRRRRPSSGDGTANNNNGSNNSIPPSTSTSHDANPTSAECEKENFGSGVESQDGDARPPAVDDNGDGVVITHDNDDSANALHEVLLEQQPSLDDGRPRQYGRRSNPLRISSAATTDSVNHAAAVISFLFCLASTSTFCGIYSKS
jgi:hypothetical protein